MSEFLFPTYEEWLEEYNKWEWKDYERDRWDPNTIFDRVSLRIRDPLSLPAQRDYYRPERASLVLGSLYKQPPAITHGALAFVAWMVRLQDVHLPTSLMGAEICRGMMRLQYVLKIPEGVNTEIKKLLHGYAYLSTFSPTAGEIVAYWVEKEGGQPPLATWLRKEAST